MRWRGYQVDGFILNTLGRGAGLIDADALHGKPAVLVDRRHAGMHTDFVSLDNAAAMKAACGHLVDGGYRELLYITEPLKGREPRRERTAAFGDCVEAHEPRVAGEVYESTGDDGDGLDAALRALHKRAKRGQARGGAGGQRGRDPARGRGDGAAGLALRRGHRLRGLRRPRMGAADRARPESPSRSRPRKSAGRRRLPAWSGCEG